MSRDDGVMAVDNTQAPARQAQMAKRDFPIANIAKEFAAAYYDNLRNGGPLHKFYGLPSRFSRIDEVGAEFNEDMTHEGYEAITDHLKTICPPGVKMEVECKTIDYQFLGNVNGVLLVTTGVMDGRMFTQSFVLAEQVRGYYVQNDTLRFISNSAEPPRDAALQKPIPITKIPTNVLPRQVAASYRNGTAAAATDAAPVVASPVKAAAVAAASPQRAPLSPAVVASADAAALPVVNDAGAVQGQQQEPLSLTSYHDQQVEQQRAIQAARAEAKQAQEQAAPYQAARAQAHAVDYDAGTQIAGERTAEAGAASSSPAKLNGVQGFEAQEAPAAAAYDAVAQVEPQAAVEEEDAGAVEDRQVRFPADAAAAAETSPEKAGRNYSLVVSTAAEPALSPRVDHLSLPSQDLGDLSSLAVGGPSRAMTPAAYTKPTPHTDSLPHHAAPTAVAVAQLSEENLHRHDVVEPSVEPYERVTQITKLAAADLDSQEGRKRGSRARGDSQHDRDTRKYRERPSRRERERDHGYEHDRERERDRKGRNVDRRDRERDRERERDPLPRRMSGGNRRDRERQVQQLVRKGGDHDHAPHADDRRERERGGSRGGGGAGAGAGTSRGANRDRDRGKGRPAPHRGPVLDLGGSRPRPRETSSRPAQQYRESPTNRRGAPQQQYRRADQRQDEQSPRRGAAGGQQQRNKRQDQNGQQAPDAKNPNAVAGDKQQGGRRTAAANNQQQQQPRGGAAATNGPQSGAKPHNSPAPTKKTAQSQVAGAKQRPAPQQQQHKLSPHENEVKTSYVAVPEKKAEPAGIRSWSSLVGGSSRPAPPTVNSHPPLPTKTTTTTNGVSSAKRGGGGAQQQQQQQQQNGGGRRGNTGRRGKRGDGDAGRTPQAAQRGGRGGGGNNDPSTSSNEQYVRGGIFVKNLPRDWKEEAVRDFFSKEGAIKSIEMRHFAQKGFITLSFANARVAEDCCHKTFPELPDLKVVQQKNPRFGSGGGRGRGGNRGGDDRDGRGGSGRFSRGGRGGGGGNRGARGGGRGGGRGGRGGGDRGPPRGGGGGNASAER